MPKAKQLTFQVTIPNQDTPQDQPIISIRADSEQASLSTDETYSCSLEDLFSQVAESYRHDKAALHRFSYYLLLQAKEFAQDGIDSVGDDQDAVFKVQE